MAWARRTPRGVVRLAGLALALSLSTCGGDDDGDTGAGQARLDENAATFRGVGLGDSRSTVIREFGQPAAIPQTEPGIPVGTTADTAELGLPWVVAPPHEVANDPADEERVLRGGDPRKGFHLLRYKGASFSLWQASGVYVFRVIQPGATTNRGVVIGDPLELAKDRYPGLACDVRNRGTEYPEYPYCAGRVGPGRYIWFGQDPIRSITMATRAMG